MKVAYENYPDYRIREKIWEGAIPVKIDLEPKDISSLHVPRTFFILAHRMSYLSVYLKEVKNHFDTYAPSPCDHSEIWFEYNRNPLCWELPIGVQYDYLVADHSKLPWSLIFHYRALPSEKITKFTGFESLRFHYINSLKESNYIRLGSAKEILNLPKEEESQLIDSIINWEFKTFWNINSKMTDLPKDEIKKFPIRVYVNELDTYIQQAHKITNEELKDVTIGDYLFLLFPNLFKKEQVIVQSERNEFEFTEVETETKIVKSYARPFKILVQGIECALETPIYWIMLNLSNLDNFIYIIIHILKS